MDIELPDGVVIEGVPEGTTKEQLLKKLQDAKHPSHKALAIAMTREKPWGSGAPKFAYDLGGNVTDAATKFGASPEIAAGAGYVANVATQALPGFLTAGRFAGPAPTIAQGLPSALKQGSQLADGSPVSLSQKPAEMLMQSALKPAQADRLSGAAGRAGKTMLSEDIGATASGMSKAERTARALDKEVEAAISASPASVSMNDVGQRLADPARRAMTQVNPQADIKAIKDTWQGFKDSPLIQALTQTMSGTRNLPVPLGAQVGDVAIPVQLAHALKRGTYQSLGGKSYGEVGSASTEAQKALARGLREEVASAVPAIADPLKREASLMNVKDVATNRVLLESNKNPMGLAALRIGDNPLSALSFLADRSAYLKSLAARLLYRGGQPQMLSQGASAADTVKDSLEER